MVRTNRKVGGRAQALPHIRFCRIGILMNRDREGVAL